MTLTPHFTLAEMLVTSTGLPNTPTAVEVDRLRRLCERVLEPWRTRIGRIRITSGYRSPRVNAAVGGSATSQHVSGEAADCAPLDTELADAWEELIGAGLPIDQAIVYQRAPGRGWIHVSHSARRERRQYLVQPSGNSAYVPWAQWTGPLVLP